MNDEQPNVTVIIVNWNNKELTIEAVKSVLTSDYQNLSVIVVDNGSIDGSAETLEAHFPNITVLRNDQNEGFAGGNNRGIERALTTDAEFLFFLNNDATIESNTITELVEVFDRSPNISGAGPYIFYHDKPGTIWFGGGSVRLWLGWIGHRHIRKQFRSDQHEPAVSDYLTGCAFMSRADFIRETGGFDDRYEMYVEDVDLSLKLRKHGRTLWVTPMAKAFHRVSSSAGGELSPFKAFHRGRSSALLFKRWLKLWEYPSLVICGFCGAVYISLKLVFRNRLPTITAIWHGIVNGLTGSNIPAKYKLIRKSE